MKTRFVALIVTASVTIYFVSFSACKKDVAPHAMIVSVKPVYDTTIFIDSSRIDTALRLAICRSCDSTKPLALNSWRFKVNNSYICGTVENATIWSGLKTLQFWGSVECTKDTGVSILTFFDPLGFDTDRNHLFATHSFFSLQDHVNYMNSWSGEILRTDDSTPNHTLALIVDTFNVSTKLMVGRFYGYAYTKDNEKSYVDGQFRIVVHNQ